MTDLDYIKKQSKEINYINNENEFSNILKENFEIDTVELLENVIDFLDAYTDGSYYIKFKNLIFTFSDNDYLFKDKVLNLFEEELLEVYENIGIKIKKEEDRLLEVLYNILYTLVNYIYTLDDEFKKIELKKLESESSNVDKFIELVSEYSDYEYEELIHIIDEVTDNAIDNIKKEIETDDKIEDDIKMLEDLIKIYKLINIPLKEDFKTITPLTSLDNKFSYFYNRFKETIFNSETIEEASSSLLFILLLGKNSRMNIREFTKTIIRDKLKEENGFIDFEEVYINIIKYIEIIENDLNLFIKEYDEEE